LVVQGQRACGLICYRVGFKPHLAIEHECGSPGRTAGIDDLQRSDGFTIPSSFREVFARIAGAVRRPLGGELQPPYSLSRAWVQPA